MKLKEFIKEYCPDIKESDIAGNKRSRSRSSASETATKIVKEYNLQYQSITQDDEGSNVYILTFSGVDIDVLDFLLLNKQDFLDKYPIDGVDQIYDRYIMTIGLLEGKDALEGIRNKVREKVEKIKLYENEDFEGFL